MDLNAYSVVLQHEDTGRDSELTEYAESPEEAEASAQRKYGKRWLIVSITYIGKKGEFRCNSST